MDKRVIAYSPKMKGDLDDDYTLYEDGEVLHEYDRHRYPGGYNLKETLRADELKDSVKERLLNATKPADKDLAKELLEIE